MNASATFKARLRAGEPLLGCFVKTPHPDVVEVLAGSGLDVLCLDAEHAAFDRGDLSRCILAARAHQRPVLVRTPSRAAHEILNALDLGATGVMAPHVRSAAEAAEVVAAATYGAGGRGYAGGTRAAGFTAPPIADRLAQAERETTVIVQLEDVEAIANARDIAAVPGVDAVFIGRIDLTVALGLTDPKAPQVLEAVTRMTAEAVAGGGVVGMFTPDTAEVAHWRELGASLFLLGSDQGFIKSGAALLRRDAGL